MIDVRHLHHVLALQEHGTFRNAAAALGLSQPALSRSIQSLEDSVGSPLFDRRRPRVVPTPVGRLLIERAHAVVGEARHLQEDLDRFLGREVGQVVAGIGPYPTEFILPQALRTLTVKYPKLRVHLRIEVWTDLYQRLRSRQIELAVASTDEIEGDEFSVLPLRPREGVVFCRAGHPVLANESPTLEDLVPYPLTSPHLPGPARRLLQRAGEPEIECNSVSAIKAIIAATDAIGIVAPEWLEDDPSAWAILPPGRGRLIGQFGVITLAGRTLSPAAEAFIECLLAADAEGAA